MIFTEGLEIEPDICTIAYDMEGLLKARIFTITIVQYFFLIYIRINP